MFVCDSLQVHRNSKYRNRQIGKTINNIINHPSPKPNHPRSQPPTQMPLAQIPSPTIQGTRNSRGHPRNQEPCGIQGAIPVRFWYEACRIPVDTWKETCQIPVVYLTSVFAIPLSVSYIVLTFTGEGKLLLGVSYGGGSIYFMETYGGGTLTL